MQKLETSAEVNHDSKNQSTSQLPSSDEHIFLNIDANKVCLRK